MRRMWFSVGMVALAMAAGSARAASFDCKLAKTAVEKAVCADTSLSAADDKLAVTYKSVMAMAPPDVQTEIRSEQRSWAGSREQTCAAIAKAQGKLPVSESDLIACLRNLYASQIDGLKQRVMKRDGIVFVERRLTLTSKNEPDEPPRGEDSGDANPGYGSLNAAWPEAQSTAPEWVAWNAAVLKATQKMASVDADVSHGWKDAWAAGAETDVTTKLERFSPQLVTVSVSRDSFGHGAAHPNEGYIEFQWMLQEKRALQVSDVFQPGSAWESVVGARCRVELKKMDQDYESYAGGKAEFAKTLHKVVSDPANWTLDPKGLTISFPEYTVTPRVEPVEPVTVPWSTVQPYLAKGFVLPR